MEIGLSFATKLVKNNTCRRMRQRTMIHLFPNGQTEAGTGKPGYRWTPAYSQVLPQNATSMQLPLKEWRAIAKRDRNKIVIHADEPKARKCIEGVENVDKI